MKKQPHRLTPAPATAHRLEPLIRLTDKGRALLAALDNDRALAQLATFRTALKEHEHGRATPCAPNRGTSAPATLPAHNAGTAGAPPAHPAGKSGAALAPKKETP